VSPGAISTSKKQKNLTLSPLARACLLILAEREAGGAHADESATAERIFRDKVSALIETDVVSVTVTVPPGALPDVVRDLYATKLREMLRGK
jgi:hypothetical protein